LRGRVLLVCVLLLFLLQLGFDAAKMPPTSLCPTSFSFSCLSYFACPPRYHYSSTIVSHFRSLIILYQQHRRQICTRLVNAERRSRRRKLKTETSLCNRMHRTGAKYGIEILEGRLHNMQMSSNANAERETSPSRSCIHLFSTFLLLLPCQLGNCLQHPRGQERCSTISRSFSLSLPFPFLLLPILQYLLERSSFFLRIVKILFGEITAGSTLALPHRTEFTSADFKISMMAILDDSATLE
jgi:hypothetical protein